MSDSWATSFQMKTDSKDSKKEMGVLPRMLSCSRALWQYNQTSLDLVFPYSTLSASSF